MKITLPENAKDITLLKFQKYSKLMKRTDIEDAEREARIVALFTDIHYRNIPNISVKDYEEIIAQIKKAIDEPVQFTSTFKLNGIDYGFIPNFDKDEFTEGERGDMTLYENDIDQLHSLMAIIFRPITKKDITGNYEIEAYNGTGDRAELFKQMPMHVVNGALVFFSTLANELNAYILNSTSKAQAKVIAQ